MSIIKNNAPLHIDSKFILLISMVFVAVMIAADTVAYDFVKFFGLTESGATILFPLTYLLGDVVCEVYGWNIAMKMVWFGLAAEWFFSVAILPVLHMSSAGLLAKQGAYQEILGNMWLFVSAGVIANAICALLNVYFISKWKILTKGRVFWVRSVLSTCITEFILILITVLIAFTHAIDLKNTLRIFFNAYFLEVIYAFIFVVPAHFLVKYLRKAENIDAYDYNVNYNPFLIFNKS